MRVKMAMKSMQVVDKLSGIVYEIESTNEQGENLPTEATAVEVLEEGDDREPQKVQINETNDITFRVTRWVKDTEIPTGFSVSNGVIMHNGKAATEMGSIRAVEIIKTFPGQIIFTAENEDDPTTNMIISYLPRRDKFSEVKGEIKTDAKVLEDSDTRQILAYNEYKDVVQTDENDEKKTVSVYDRTVIVVITENSVRTDSVTAKHMWYNEEDEESDKALNLDNIVFSEDKRILLIGVDNYDKKEVAYEAFRVTNTAAYNGETYVCPGKVTSITRNRANNISDYLYIGENFIDIKNVRMITDSKLSVISEGNFNYLVDLRDDVDRLTIVVANKDRNIKTVTVKRTTDRGNIISVA